MTPPTGVFTVSVTTGAFPSTAAMADTTGVAANGSAGPCCCVPAATAENESVTAGMRRRTTLRPCCAAVGFWRAIGGIAGGAWSLGTVSGGNQTPATRSAGSGATYAGNRSAFTAGAT